MTITARGLLTLGGVQFTTDPDPYEHYQWPKRMSEHPYIGGGVVIQDFGVNKADLTITLGSGNSQFLERSVVLSLDTMYRTKGTTYTLTDWLGNEMTVFISEFKPTAARFGTAYRYTMTLRVRTITKLLGASYTGT